jgi:hypothetical protein
MDEQDILNQQIGAQMSRAGYSVTSNNEINSLLSELTNPEQEIYEVEKSLKGIDIDENGKEIRKTEPLLNNKGVANMIRLMRSMLNRVMFMSNLEEIDVRNLVMELSYQIQDDLIMHKKDYDIKDVTDMTTIRTIISYKAFEAGMTALDNGFRRFLKQGIIETTINTQGQGLKTGKGGGIGSILGLGKK